MSVSVRVRVRVYDTVWYGMVWYGMALVYGDMSRRLLVQLLRQIIDGMESWSWSPLTWRVTACARPPSRPRPGLAFTSAAHSIKSRRVHAYYLYTNPAFAVDLADPDPH